MPGPRDAARSEPSGEDPQVAALSACCAAPSFPGAVLAGAPYPDAAAAGRAAAAVVRGLPWAEVLAALAGHPRIGERMAGDSAEAAASRREQASLGSADDAVRTAIVEGNVAYEERFGTVFLVRAAGRTQPEVLAELRRRLGNDPADERAEVTEQLAQIAELRVAALDPALLTG